MYNKDRCHPRLLCGNVNARAPGEFDLCYPKHPGAYLKTCYDGFRGRRGFKILQKCPVSFCIPKESSSLSRRRSWGSLRCCLISIQVRRISCYGINACLGTIRSHLNCKGIMPCKCITLKKGLFFPNKKSSAVNVEPEDTSRFHYSIISLHVFNFAFVNKRGKTFHRVFGRKKKKQPAKHRLAGRSLNNDNLFSDIHRNANMTILSLI